MKKVIVLGGGVAGMTAAHELSERGFAVTLYERRKHTAGGKARTEWDKAQATDGRGPWPGEHGFRFFPGFYKHVPDTMRRIPYPGNAHGVFDNLINCERGLMAPMGHPSFETLVAPPASIADLKVLWAMPQDLQELGLTPADLEFFLGKIWQILTSCGERRLQEYGRISWWEFVDAANRSPAYQLYLAIGLTRNAVACQAQVANTRTVGDIGIQLALNMAEPGECGDRILNGPTSTVWLDPWLQHIRGLGVDYRFDSLVSKIHFDKGAITGVTVVEKGVSSTVHADYYVCALPVEIVDTLLTPEMLEFDSVLKGIHPLAQQLNWMTGIQYFLAQEVDIVPGHINCLGSPWALTAIGETQFWPGVDMANLGDGRARGILSVDISDWNAAGLPGGPAQGKIAMDCTPDEIAAEAWYQLKQCINTGGKTLLTDYAAYFLDDDIQPGGPAPHREVNLEPLLVNRVNSWDLRPDSYSRIPNLFLAGDYIRTHTDFASMEAANEAARRAVNALLYASGYDGPLCMIWDLHEPDLVAPLRLHDAKRFAMGMPWSPVSEMPREWLQDLKTAFSHFLGR